MNTADPDGPNYLKPPEGFGQIPMNTCPHETILPLQQPTDKAKYYCQDCQQPFPESLIEEKDGKYVMVDFSRYSKGPRRR